MPVACALHKIVTRPTDTCPTCNRRPALGFIEGVAQTLVALTLLLEASGPPPRGEPLAQAKRLIDLKAEDIVPSETDRLLANRAVGFN